MKKNRFKDFIAEKTARKISEALGCTTAAVSSWMRDRTRPKRDVAKKLIEFSKGQLTWEDIYSVK